MLCSIILITRVSIPIEPSAVLFRQSKPHLVYVGIVTLLNQPLRCHHPAESGVIT